FKEKLTGPEYIEKWITHLNKRQISIRLNATILTLTNDKLITVQSPEGIFMIKAEAIIFATGCMEQHRGGISLAGPRVSGVMTAGVAQRLLNLKGWLPGKKTVILGSGDMGLIMAQKMILAGSNVLGVFEIMPYSMGLARNIVQCLDDYHIPIYFSKTVQKIHGKTRLEGVTVISVDENRAPILGTEEYIECDTLLLSVGLIPMVSVLVNAGVEIDPITKGTVVNHMMETSVKGVFACGNVVHVHDLVDNVALEAEQAAIGAVKYIQGDQACPSDFSVLLLAGKKFIYTVPKILRINTEDKFYELSFRVNKPIIGMLTIIGHGKVIFQQKQKHFSPGEIEKLMIPSTIITKDLSEITVEIIE
ncbi:MAG: NAD(P)/FAD-dependent oxidoreductase, partial [Brevinema sp.]